MAIMQTQIKLKIKRNLFCCLLKSLDADDRQYRNVERPVTIKNLSHIPCNSNVLHQHIFSRKSTSKPTRLGA